MLTEVEVMWYRTSTDGTQEHLFTTFLEDAIVVDISTVLPHAQNPSNASYTQLVKVAMNYRKIT
ncbi:hypothetical protein G7009_04340 [Pseudomonas capeferrum]|nr:hypothetical protein [Pseudomonas capeferrum]